MQKVLKKENNDEDYTEGRLRKEYAESKSVYEIAQDLSEGLARMTVAGELNGEVVDLRTVIDQDCELNILTLKDEKALPVCAIPQAM